MRFTTDLNPIIFVRRESDSCNVRNIHLNQIQLTLGNPKTIERMVREFVNYDEENYIYRLFVECDEGMVHIKSKRQINKNEFMSSDEVENYIQEFSQKKIETPKT
jgi:hypothetical protein